MDQINCPKGHGIMEQKEIPKTVPFKGLDINIVDKAFVCPVCRLSAGTIQSAANIQKTIANAYKKHKKLLSGEAIRELRKSKNMTQTDLAALMEVGVASIKRWETGAIQSRSMDKLLRQHLQKDSDRKKE